MSLIGLSTLGLHLDTRAQRSTQTPLTPMSRDLIAEQRTRDRLVELHVLAEHGDSAAAAEAEQWLDDDPDARRVWHQVEARCQELRADAATPGRPRPGTGLPDHAHRHSAPPRN